MEKRPAISTSLSAATPTLMFDLTYPIRESGWVRVLIGAGVRVLAGRLAGLACLEPIVAILGGRLFHCLLLPLETA